MKNVNLLKAALAATTTMASVDLSAVVKGIDQASDAVAKASDETSLAKIDALEGVLSKADALLGVTVWNPVTKAYEAPASVLKAEPCDDDEDAEKNASAPAPAAGTPAPAAKAKGEVEWPEDLSALAVAKSEEGTPAPGKPSMAEQKAKIAARRAARTVR